MRLAIYCDFAYRRAEAELWAEVAFVRFLGAVAGQLDGATLVGRLDPVEMPWHHRVPGRIDFEPLPFYSSLARPLAAGRALVESVRRFWRVLDRVDAVWLFGPHPLALAFAALAAVRRRPIALGVRQDLRHYTRTRRPNRVDLQIAAHALEGCFRLLSRRCAVVVVGTALAVPYRAARALLETTVSLASEADIAPADERDYSGQLRVLSVGRLDPEKNALLLADVLEELVRRDSRWRLVVCGDGILAAELAETISRRGLQERAEFVGYVPLEAGLWDLYRSSHFLLHTAWTEGVPQVLFEAFAQRLPVVATAVGGVADVARGAALLVPPGDAWRCADALAAFAGDEGLRARLVAGGVDRARAHSLESQTSRVALFLEEALGRARSERR